MSFKEGQILVSYKKAFYAAFALILLGGIFILLGDYLTAEAYIDRYGFYGDTEDQRKAGLILRTLGRFFILIGGIVFSIKTFYLALEPEVIESENVRVGLLILSGLVLAFVAAINTVMLLYPG